MMMRGEIAFLRKSAAELRDVASLAPDLSEQLVLLAKEIEAQATELVRESTERRFACDLRGLRIDQRDHGLDRPKLIRHPCRQGRGSP
jgi:hypothetical protein